MSMNRREALRTLTSGVLAGSVLRSIPEAAAQQVHEMVQSEKSASPSGNYAPKFFPAAQYKTLQMLAQLIIPADGRSGGAMEGGAPEFIDLLCSENEDYALRAAGGLRWLDAACDDRYSAAFADASPAQQDEILQLIAFRKNAESDSQLLPGVQFFAFIRRLTVDAFFSSKVGIADLGYIGNKYVRGPFPGCPPPPALPAQPPPVESTPSAQTKPS